ncbi:hypothetical protein TTHT_0615 [Thermotomaculum hydrothermale]|uniref:Micrococcal nuclease n=1 Tax=Thermotomaculum hydrothermale TaxID=981385 RepID=A0A7R6PN86_9BACT|nr:thermonuclease family protein [Thermotomaculum hydrothermale]BBB32196.1 hypothetical protein TTHT_0615 [Thermotomaculum hydrothermale]
MLKFQLKKISLFLILAFITFNAKTEIIQKQNTLEKYLNLDQAVYITGKVINVIDGDTIKIERDDNGTPEKIRFLGINTPEKGYYDNDNYIEDPEPYSIDATNYIYNIVNGKTVKVYYAKDDYYSRDSYGRLLGVVVYNGRILNIELLREGLAKRYFYNANPILKFEEWTKAEASARIRRVNMWSDYHKNRIVITEVYPDPPGNETDTGKEFIEIKNFGKDQVNLKNWLFMFDKSTHYSKLTSNDFILNPGEVCVISTVDEATFRSLFPSVPQSAKYLQSQDNFWFTNNPTPIQQRIFYLATPDRHIEEVLTFSLDWYDGLRNGGKSLQRVNFRKIETGIQTSDSPDKELFKADTPNPGIVE